MIKKIFANFKSEHGFTFYKPTILVRMSQDTLHIINFDVYDYGFDCKVAIQPLFVPGEAISLSFGNRLSHLCEHSPGIWGQGNEIEVEEDFQQVKALLENNALPWFEKVGHPEGLINFLSDENFEENKDMIVGLPPFMRRLFLAMGYLYCGNTSKAASEVRIFHDLTNNEAKPWMLELKKFAYQIDDLILYGDSGEIVQHFKKIIQETKSNLKLKIS